MRSENSAGSSNTHMSTMQAGSRCIVARWAGGLEWRGFMLRCRRWLGPSAVPATDGASRTGSGPSRRNKVDTTVQPSTSNCQQDTRRKRFQPLLFSTEHMRRLRCRRVDDSPSRARQRSEDGHWARPPVPTAPLPPSPPVPRRGVPSIAQCVESWSRLRNAHEDRSSRSSLLHRETTLYQIYPDLRRALLPLPPAAAPRPPLEWRPGKHPSPACRTAKFALFMRQPARWRGWYGTRRPSPSGQFVRSTPPPAAAKRTAGERSGREAINTGSRPCDRLAAPFCATLPR